MYTFCEIFQELEIVTSNKLNSWKRKLVPSVKFSFILANTSKENLLQDKIRRNKISEII